MNPKMTTLLTGWQDRMSERDKWNHGAFTKFDGDEASADYLVITTFKDGQPDSDDIERMKCEMEARVTQNLSNGWFVAYITHATDGYTHYFKVAVRRNV